MRLTKDKLGCVFDVPTDLTFIIEESWKGDKFATLEKLAALPELLEGVSDSNKNEGFNKNNQQNNWNKSRNNSSFNSRSNSNFQNNFSGRKQNNFSDRKRQFNNNDKFNAKKQKFGW